MKKMVIFFGAFLLTGQYTYSQCCPYVDPIEIIPVSPSEIDSIYVVTNVTTPNQGAYLGYTITDLGNTVRIEACYYNGMLTALQSYTDTINIGVKPDGTYDIEFVAYQSGNDITCDYSDSNEVSATVVVTPFLEMSPANTEDQILISPNPVTDGLMHLALLNSDEPVSFFLYNTLGEIVLTGKTNSAEPVLVDHLQGIFFICISLNDERITQKIVID